MLATEALNDIRNILISDTDIKEFCNTKYNKDITVFLGADERDLPDINNAPYILLDRASVKFNEKNLDRDAEYEFYALVCVYQERITKDANGSIYNGVLEIDELCYKVRNAVSAAPLAISFVSESLAGTSDAPLRRYPIYYHIERAQIKLKEER